MPTGGPGGSSSILYSLERPDIANLDAILRSASVERAKHEGLDAYRRMVDLATGTVRVEYTIASGNYGRFVATAKKGAKKTYTTGASMQRVFRNLLFGDAYDDLDIVNASGNILCQLFQKHGLRTDRMTYLNENREEILQMIMNSHPLRVERATAKETLIAVFNCGSGRASMQQELGAFADEHALPPFVEGLKQEIRHNVGRIANLPEYGGIMAHLTQREAAKGKEAWVGQFAANLYQDEERKCLEVMVEEIVRIAQERQVERPIGSLIHDGLTVRKELEIELYRERIERHVARRTSYILKLEIKAMVVSTEERDMYIGAQPVDASYEAKKARFERSCFKTKMGKLKFHTIDEDTGELISESKEAFSVAYEDWIPAGGRQFLCEWFADGRKRCYKNIEYSCVNKDDQLSTVYYAFPEIRHEKLESISTEEQKQANVAYFLDYVRLLVEDNPTYVEWMVMWLADILVNPHDKGNQPIAVILWGEQGAGKTCLRELMAQLLGARLVHHTDDPLKNGDIMHDFNSTLKYKLFIEFEEINFKTHSKVADNIKALITGHTHTITHKGADSADVKATERALFTTNNAGSMVVERNDRRYAAFAVSARRVGDTTYWNAHYGKLADQSYVRDVAEYLLSQKDALAGYALRDKRPLTDYYKSLQQLATSPELDFLRDAFLYGAHELAEFMTHQDIYSIPSSMFAARYNAWRVVNGMRDTTSSKSFNMKLASHGSAYGITQERTSRCNNFVIDAAKLRAAIRRDFSIPAP